MSRERERARSVVRATIVHSHDRLHTKTNANADTFAFAFVGERGGWGLREWMQGWRHVSVRTKRGREGPRYCVVVRERARACRRRRQGEGEGKGVDHVGIRTRRGWVGPRCRVVVRDRARAHRPRRIVIVASQGEKARVSRRRCQGEREGKDEGKGALSLLCRWLHPRTDGGGGGRAITLDKTRWGWEMSGCAQGWMAGPADERSRFTPHERLCSRTDGEASR